jgi:hypothetical protein
MYMRVPTPQEQERAEWGMGPLRTFKSLGKWSYGHERLISTDPADAIVATDEVPEFFRDHRSIPGSPWNPSAVPKVHVIPNGSGFSYTKAFEAAGRTWLLTPDLLLVPADRAFPYKPSAFQGVKLGGDVQLPVAWIRSDSEKKLLREDDGTLRETGETAGKVAVRSRATRQGQRRPTTRHASQRSDCGDRGRIGRAYVPPPRTIGPGRNGSKRGSCPEPSWPMSASRPSDNVMVGGRGRPCARRQTVFDATTEMGTFSFQWKDAVATMSPTKGAVSVFWFADVPHIQHPRPPRDACVLLRRLGIWSAEFGLSPIDAHWLFSWTLPALPGWGSVRPSKAMGPRPRS